MNNKISYLLAISLLLLIACEKEKAMPKEEFSTPVKTYRLWLESADKQDIQESQRCMTEDSKRIIDEQLRSMDQLMARLKDNIKVFKTYTLFEEKTKDDKAVVILKGPKGDIMVIPLKKEAEGWKIDLLSILGGAG